MSTVLSEGFHWSCWHVRSKGRRKSLLQTCHAIQVFQYLLHIHCMTLMAYSQNVANLTLPVAKYRAERRAKGNVLKYTYQAHTYLVQTNFHHCVVVSHLFGANFIKQASSKAVHDVAQHIQGKGIWIQQVNAHLTNCNAGLALTAAVHQKQSTYIHSCIHSLNPCLHQV